MYTKLFKNFITKNLGVFILILTSITLSLFGYTFSDSLSKNFLYSIERDAKKNLGGDFAISLGKISQIEFEQYYSDFQYKDNLAMIQDYSIYSSVEIANDIQSITLHYTDVEFPFYSEYEKIITNSEGDVIISEKLYNQNQQRNSIMFLGVTYSIRGYYTQLPSTLNGILSEEHAFINIERYSENITNDNNTLIYKEYFFKNSDESLFDEINTAFNNGAEQYDFRVTNYKNGGDRFEDIISTLKSYINYAILFSFFLTVTIIFLSCSSFFIKERKELSILRLLGMRNKQFITFYVFLFSSALLISLIIAYSLSYASFAFLQNYEATLGFTLFKSSLLSGFIIGVLLLVFSITLPIIKFISNEANGGLREDFFTNVTFKEKIVALIFFLVMIITLSLILGYTVIISLIVSGLIIVFILLFSLFSKYLLEFFYRIAQKLRNNHFPLFDAIRTSRAPGNMSLLLNLSFFIIFSIGLFILLLFGNFYNRLSLNLESDNNLFVLNIDGDTYEKLDEKYKKNTFSLIKGRISTINNISIGEHLGGEDESESGSKGNQSNRFTREFNITDNTLADIKILEGKKVEKGGVSVDKNFAQDLQVGLGDEITFTIYGLEKTLTITGIRESQDYSINPFFYFQVDQNEFENFPKLYFLSDTIDLSQIETIKKYFYDISNGTVSFIEVNGILEQLKEISKKVLLVIQSLFLYIVTFCILSIIVVGLFFRQFQKQNASLYHFIGFTHKQNKRKNFFEYGFLATTMLVISIIIISFIAYYLITANELLSFDFIVYIQSLLIIIIVYMIILSGLRFSIKEGNNK